MAALSAGLARQRFLIERWRFTGAQEAAPARRLHIGAGEVGPRRLPAQTIKAGMGLVQRGVDAVHLVGNERIGAGLGFQRVQAVIIGLFEVFKRGQHIRHGHARVSGRNRHLGFPAHENPFCS